MLSKRAAQFCTSVGGLDNTETFHDCMTSSFFQKMKPSYFIHKIKAPDSLIEPDSDSYDTGNNSTLVI